LALEGFSPLFFGSLHQSSDAYYTFRLKDVFFHTITAEGGRKKSYFKLGLLQFIKGSGGNVFASLDFVVLVSSFPLLSFVWHAGNHENSE